MLLRNLIIFSIFCNICLGDNQRDLPSDFPRCYRNDLNLNSCLLKATEQVRPYLQKGIPELNIPKIAPLEITKLTFGEDSQFANYTITLTNAELSDLDTYKFKDLQFDPESLTVKASLKFSSLKLQGNFSLHGKILGVPIHGNGGVALNFTNTNGTLNQQCKLVSKKGTSYLEALKTDITFRLGPFTYDYNGLYEDLPRIQRVVDAVIHEHDHTIAEQFRPVFGRAVAQIAETLLFRKLYRIPYEKLFPLHG